MFQKLTQGVFIIAEAGVNHNGEEAKAYELVDIAAAAGADAVKFQTFRPGECTGKYAVKVDYLKKSSSEQETRFDITKKLALPFEAFQRIQAYAQKKGILFLTTPDGFESLEYVHQVLDVPVIKVSSTEVTHLNFLRAVAKTMKPVILSTGLSNLDEVGKALEVIRAYHQQVVVLHCTSSYPTRPEEANLQAMVSMQKAFCVAVGYSDHTLGWEAGIMAVALGACVIEKHFTIDKTLPGPDHSTSLNLGELKDFVAALRKARLMLGDGEKKPSEAELRNRDGIRRSVVAARDLSKGTRLIQEDITCKRPGTGIHPYEFEKVIGRVTKRDFKADEPIVWEDLA